MDWITTANGIIALLTGLVGLIGTGIGAFYAVKNFISMIKEKNKNEIWVMIMEIADAAMREAEETGKTGADKKTLVVETVKAACISAGLNIDGFIDQLSIYIDDTISFVNKMNQAKK